MIRCREVLIVAALLLGGVAHGDERDERLLRLGEHFYTAGHYYRAVGVFEELTLFTTDPPLAIHGRLRIAQSYHHGQQVDEAVAAYDDLLRQPLDADTASYVRLLRAIVRADAVPLSDLTAELEPLAAAGGPVEPLALYHLARLRLASGDRKGAGAAGLRAHASCRARPVDDCAALEKLAAPLQWSGPRHRSPALGLALSAIVPGLGAAYAGHWFDAGYYLLLSVGPGLMAWDVWDGDRGTGDQVTSFYVLAAVAATFYTANVAQGWFGAARFNDIERWQYRRRLLRATDWPLPLEDHAPR